MKQAPIIECDCNLEAYSIVYALLTTLLLLWFIVAVLLQGLMCGFHVSNITSEWFYLLLYTTCFCGQYVYGYIMVYIANQKENGNIDGMQR